MQNIFIWSIFKSSSVSMSSAARRHEFWWHRQCHHVHLHHFPLAVIMSCLSVISAGPSVLIVNNGAALPWRTIIHCRGSNRHPWGHSEPVDWYQLRHSLWAAGVVAPVVLCGADCHKNRWMYVYMQKYTCEGWGWGWGVCLRFKMIQMLNKHTTHVDIM